MVFHHLTEDERKLFFKQGYTSHLPGYTGHCPTLKFRVGKRFGASTEEILKDLLAKGILKTGPYKPNQTEDEKFLPISLEKGMKRSWKNDDHYFKSPPYILGYTGYIPGFNNVYGLPFMKAVEEGAKEWRETQNKLRARRDSLRSHAERMDPRNLLSRIRTDNVETEVDHAQDNKVKQVKHFDNRVTPDRPPVVGYTGHIPLTRGEMALSKRYTLAAKKGLEFLCKERESRMGKSEHTDAAQRVLDVTYIDDTGHTRA